MLRCSSVWPPEFCRCALEPGGHGVWETSRPPTCSTHPPPSRHSVPPLPPFPRPNDVGGVPPVVWFKLEVGKLLLVSLHTVFDVLML